MDLVLRAGHMLYRPRREWAVIAAEPRAVGGLVLGYVMIVAGLALAVEFAAELAAGVPLGAAVGTALSGYVQALAGIALLTVVAKGLAPRFGGVGDLGQSFKLAAFGGTPAWLGGVFLPVPGIGGTLALAASFYGIYVYFLGIPALMGVPAGGRRLGYCATVLVLTLGLAMALALCFGVLTGQARMTIVHG